MKTKEVTIDREGRIRMAQYATKQVAEMKDWRIRNKYNRQQREAARKLIAGQGYMEMTQADAHSIDNSIEEVITVVKVDNNGNAHTKRERADKELKIWGYMWNSEWKKIQLTAF